MFTNKKKTTCTKKIYNINNNIYQNSDYIFNNEKNYYYQKSQINTYSIKTQGQEEYIIEKKFINNNNNFNENNYQSKSSDKNLYERIEEKKIKYNKKNRINERLNYGKNNNNSYKYKLYSNNFDLIKKKIELEEQRERERKVLEWFYINNINPSKRDMYDALTTLIQSVFRGWQFRNKIANIFHNYNINNNSQDINDIKNGLLLLNKIYFDKLRKYLIFLLSRIKDKKIKEENDQKEKMYNEIKELIKQNNELQKKLGNILNENKNLKNETEKYKEYKNKYKKISDQIEKIYSVNNNIIEENQNLKNKINEISNNNDEKKNNQFYIIDKLKSINYINKNYDINKKFEEKETQYDLGEEKNINKLYSKKNNIDLNKFEIQNINQINIYSNNLSKSKINFEIEKENNINILSLNKNIKKELSEKENNLILYKDKLRNIILKNIISKIININKDKIGINFFKFKNKANEIKIKEKEEEIKNLQNEVELLKNNLNEKENNNSTNNQLLQNNLIKLNKLKSLFKYKLSLNKCTVHKYFFSFYYKVFSTKNNQKSDLIPTKISSYTINPLNIPPITTDIINPNNSNLPIITDIINPNNTIPPIENENSQNENKEIDINKPIRQIDDEKINKEKKEKEEMEKKARLLKARNLRKLLNKKAHEKKDNKRKYFYKYVHIIMMMKIRNKLIEMKRKQIEKELKEEKKENEKYRLIQKQRDKQERIFAIFNKLDKRISQIKRTVLEAWNVKAKVMSIKTILQPLKNKPKKKKKKVKKEQNKNVEGKDEVINMEKN